MTQVPPQVLALIHLPPPVHGISIVSEAVRRRLQTRTSVRTQDLAYGALTARSVRASTYLAPIVNAIRQAADRRTGTTCYLAASGGLRLYADFAIVAASKARGKRVALHHHSTAYITKRSSAMALICRLLGPRDISVFLDDQHAIDFRRRYRLKTMDFAVSNLGFFDDWPVAGPRRLRRKRPRIGFLANIETSKGILNFLALSGLEHLSARYDFVVAGPFRDEESKRAVTQAAAEGAISYRGPVYGADKDRFFDDIDLFVFPTEYQNETEPLVVLEAMNRGIPVVSTEAGYLREMLGTARELAVPSERFLPDAEEAIKRVFAAYSAYSEEMAANVNLRRKRAEESVRAWLAEMVQEDA